MHLETGQRLGDYVIRGAIGAGGMGEVYRAHDTSLERDVAIKVLPREVAEDPERRARFEREAKSIAALNHENIVTIHAIGEADGVRYLAMELVEGESINRRIPDGGLASDEMLGLAIPIASALAAAHAKGIVHRDLKPANVMVTDEGKVKVLDFGLAKLAQSEDELLEPVGEDSPTATMTLQTRAGVVVGTMPYMSPEQLSGKPVGPPSDIFSFGVMLYEMATGTRPFQGSTGPTLISSILTDSPPPVADLRPGLPSGLGELIERCLSKDPAARPADASELRADLEALRSATSLSSAPLELPAPRRNPWPRIAAIAVVLVAVSISAFWLVGRANKQRWARNEALPEIERLYNSGDSDGAMRLLYEASEIIPDDPYLMQYFNSIAVPLAIDSDPPGATVYVKGYNHPDREWIRLGVTPIENTAVPLPARFRIEKEGFATFEGAPFGMRQTIRLFREEEIPPGMVYVPGGTAEFGAAEPVALDGFWIDTYEVTNREFRSFVDNGGYRDDRLWAAGADRTSFVDTTGRPGPAGWALGSYPDGEDDLPVGGVSWFEASAFAAWAGKSLPTVFHWRLAARQSIFSEILLWSNFDTGGPAAVGTYAGLGPCGTYDMAGNVREWCLNRTGDLRHILGGAWSEPDYLYRRTEAADPHDRSAINGFRCMRTDEPPPDAAQAAIEHPIYDHRQDTAIDDDAFAIVQRSFDYDDRDIDAQVESTDDRPEHWRHEVASVRAAYGDERLPIHLYLPKNVDPPYQAVVYFPPSSARFLRDPMQPSFPFAHFIPQSGRALIYPIYKGTYNRRVDVRGPNDDRDLTIQFGKDLRRTIDFLQTREDIDNDRLAFYGLSWGGYYGPLLTAIEPRFAASILVAAGLYRVPDDWPPADVPQNFAPRSTVPTLMINGRKDFRAPVETNIQPLFDMLATPAEDKRLVLLDGGHVPSSTNEVIREVLDWLDLYLGPVDFWGRSIAASGN